MDTKPKEGVSPQVQKSLDMLKSMASALQPPTEREKFLYAAGRRAYELYVREQRRFYMSIACNMVLLIVIWVAL